MKHFGVTIELYLLVDPKDEEFLSAAFRLTRLTAWIGKVKGFFIGFPSSKS